MKIKYSKCSENIVHLHFIEVGESVFVICDKSFKA